MAESHDNPATEEERGDSAQVAAADLDKEMLDDAPTIISRPSRQPARPEDSFAEGLRGRKLLHFELVEPIGIGGMAAVIRAIDTHLGRCVALKILPPDLASDPENIRRFEQEARAAARLDHENIARVYFCGKDQGLHFIAFEFVEGENLRMILERRGVLSIPEAINYMLQIGTGLAHACERGVVHRDIKPSNIIVGPNGRAKLVDMGLARSLEPLHGDNLTQSGVTLGTFDYISPEQALEPHSADSRSDIYSLGCTFYQLLTRHAPVPDGTYAKKLHHHQHVAPTDPRQLNPDIPDELAAILAKMMAKDAKDRYQRPEHLVQHLVQLAQRLGTAAEVPDGLVFMDAPLPAPPRMRPLLVVAVSAFLLVGLVVLHSMSSLPNYQAVDGSWPQHQGVPEPQLPDGMGKAKDKGTGPDVPVPPPVAAKIERREIKTAQEFEEFLAEGHAHAEIRIVDDINLTPEKDKAAPGLTYQGGADGSLVIEGKDGRRKIRLDYNAVGTEWAALTIKGGTVTLRNLRFEVNANEADKILMAAVKLQQSGQVTIENCEFIQYQPPGTDKGRLSSVAIIGSADSLSKPSMTIRRSYFARAQLTPTGVEVPLAQDAVTVSDFAALTLEECAFGPHDALVHLLEGGKEVQGQANVRMSNCSAFLVNGAAFRVDEASGLLEVRNTLFSNPQGKSSPTQTLDAVLVKQTGLGFLKYTGSRNRYHHLHAFWRDENAASALDWDQFVKDRPNVKENDSELLAQSPWREKNPLRLIDYGQPMQAFQLVLTRPELRLPDGKLVGPERCAWGVCYHTPLPPPESRTPPRRFRQIVVDPARESGSGSFHTLGQAVAEAKPGDEILIRKNGLLDVHQVRLEDADINLTIRPYDPSYNPILTLGKTIDKQAFLFRLHDGKLRFENLEFQLKPRGRGDSASIIQITGTGRCELVGCAVTLEADGSDETLPALSLAALIDRRSQSAVESERDMPELSIDKSFVRGEGALLRMAASQSFKLDAANSLFVLGNSLVTMGGTLTEDPGQAAPAEINFKSVTCYLAGHLLNLRTSNSTRDLVTINVHVTDSLFVAAKGQTLIHFDGNIPNSKSGEMMILRTLTWAGSGSAYSNFKDYLDHQPKSDEMPLMPFGKDKWETFAKNEPNRIIETVKFADMPTTEQGIARALPKNFKPMSANTEIKGAQIAQLPSPQVDSGVLAPAPGSE